MRSRTRRDVSIALLSLASLSGCSAFGGRENRTGWVTIQNSDDESHTVILETRLQNDGAGGTPTPQAFEVPVSPGEEITRDDIFDTPGTYQLRVSLEGSQETATETLEFFENAQGGIGGPMIDIEITERGDIAIGVATLE